MELLTTFNEEAVTEEELTNFYHRRATRVIAFDEEGKIAFLYMRNRDYHEIPGGGVEEKETVEEGALREAREEAGCDVRLVEEVGRTLEYRRNSKLINETFCYIGEVISKGDPDLAQDEIDEGMMVMWVDIDEAIRLIQKVNTPVGLYGRYMTDRAVLFMNKVKEIRGL